MINTIRNENCLATMADMPDNYVDLVVTSPPYDNMRQYDGYQLESFENIVQSLYRVIKANGIIVWVVADQTVDGDETATSFKQALYFKQIGFQLFDTMIYLKPPQGAVGNNKTYWQCYEYMFIFSKGQPKTINLIRDRKNKDVRDDNKGTRRLANDKLEIENRKGYSEYGRRTNVWEYQSGYGHSATDKTAHEHPAIFPERLAYDHMVSWSNETDIVYDPFMGSGTVAVVAKLNNRTYIGSEINTDYHKIAQKRVENTMIQLKMELDVDYEKN